MSVVSAGLDIETTGLTWGDHRMVEIFIGLWKNGKKVFQFEQRLDPQRSISVEAQRVHGISASDLIGAPTWEMQAPTVQKILERADQYVWHNGESFDGPFLSYEFQRVGLTLPDRPSLDTMKEGVWATPDGKKPTLMELCFACGVPYDPSLAHAAAYDVERMMECYHKGLAWGFYPQPATRPQSIAA